MTPQEMRFQVALSCIQGVLEAKHGIFGEIVPSVAVKESLRIADEFVKQWFGDTVVDRVEEDVKVKVKEWIEEEENENECPICGCALDADGCCSYCGYGRR